MQLRNLNISKQINITLAIILFFVVFLGVIATMNSNSIWQNAKSLYENPLTVQIAIGTIKSDVLSIRLQMKEIILTEDNNEIQDSIVQVDILEYNIYKNLDILYNSYLGDISDVDAINDSLLEWKVIRDETIYFMKDHKYYEAILRSSDEGIGVLMAKEVLSHVEEINIFAQNKGAELYIKSLENRNNNLINLGITILILISITGLVSLILRKGLLSPLMELTAVTKDIELGNLGARSNYESTNEFGALSNSFNVMIDTIQNEMKNKENAWEVSLAMFKQDELHSFSHELLKALMENTDSQVGAVYLLDKQLKQYTHFESIGLTKGNYRTFSSFGFEGEFGSVIISSEIKHITNIPSDAQITFNTVSGDMKVREIITVPIKSGLDIVAIVSIASIKEYSSAVIQLINTLMNEITARFGSIMASKEITEFSKVLSDANTELLQQSKEMEIQKNELLQQNIELEIQKEQLTEASQLKSSFLSNMSHELRTPLNSVISLASVLHRRLKGLIPSDEYSYIEVIERNGKNLLFLVNELLDLSRIESGKEEILLSKFNPYDVVSELVEMIDSQAQSKGISVVNYVESNLPEIICDRNKCRQILQNIIGNALKFTEEGEIVISSKVNNNGISIIISDTGIGIPKDAIDFIFDEFRQVDESPSRKKGGTGLGLAIAKKYAQLIDGEILVESNYGQGTTFTLMLPFESKKHDLNNNMIDFSRSIDIKRQLNEFNGKNKKILLVDDSEFAIIQTMDILLEQGYELKVARNGKEALECIQKSHFDGVILDLMMPDMDGFQVLELIRKQEKYSGLPILILSAKHISKSELSFLKSNNVYQLIQKGTIDKKELLLAVGNLTCSNKNIRARKKSSKVVKRKTALILIVEDNPDNMLTTKVLLSDTYDIIEAVDGKEGVEQAKKFNPSLILMDISLPEMDGFQAFSNIRQDKKLGHIPIIALTANAMTGIKERIIDYGFDGFITKPIDKEELDKVIGRYLNENK